mmetsp:Transcript_40951/g.128341  ORF Transcript_40951/g.128341 Transcript_40951/m.128341 type:complete len:184 (-) Transcript_40951:376-927(-)
MKFSGNMDTQAFNMVMATILRREAQNIFRSKGVLSFEGEGETKFVFQGVHEQIDFGPAKSPWKAGEERLNKLVFIGAEPKPKPKPNPKPKSRPKPNLHPNLHTIFLGRGLERDELEGFIKLAQAPVSDEVMGKIQREFYDAMETGVTNAYEEEDAAFEEEGDEALAAAQAAYQQARQNGAPPS